MGRTLGPHSEANAIAIVAGYTWVKVRQGDVALPKIEGALAPPSLCNSLQLLAHCQRLAGWYLHMEQVKASSQSPLILLEGSQGRQAGSVSWSARGFGVIQADHLKHTNDKGCLELDQNLAAKE